MGSKYEINVGDQCIGCCDISASMNETEKSLANQTRLKGSLETFGNLIKEATKVDPDGVKMFSFGKEVHDLGNISADQVSSVLGKLRANEGFTNTHLVVKAAWDEHLAMVAKGHTENTLVFIATDGEPTDRAALTAQLKAIAAQQEAGDERFSISFLIVPSLAEADAGLRAYMTDLDDVPMKDKNGADIDYIDVKDLIGIDFATAAEGAIND